MTAAWVVQLQALGLAWELLGAALSKQYKQYYDQ
jgi:hypothetical protein